MAWIVRTVAAVWVGSRNRSVNRTMTQQQLPSGWAIDNQP
jgi:hypothetical protein